MAQPVHPEWEALRSAVVAAPDDDTVRLVAADWLDEHDDPDRAAFIRAQVELVRQLIDDPKSADVARLRKIERAYLGPLSHFPGLWGATDCPQLVRVKPSADRESLAFDVTGADRVRFRRGFVERVEVPAVEWLHHGVAVRATNPIEAVSLYDADQPTRDQWYQMLPALIGLPKLVLASAGGQTYEWLLGFLPGTLVDTY